MLKSLQRQPGKHLVMVRYGHGHPHYVHDEWVYNSADIDSAKVVSARELNTDQDEKVISYFSDRHLWLVEPDNAPVALKPYTPPTLITSTNTQYPRQHKRALPTHGISCLEIQRCPVGEKTPLGFLHSEIKSSSLPE